MRRYPFASSAFVAATILLVAGGAEAQYEKATVASFSTTSTTFVDVPGGALSFYPRTTSDVWVILFSAKLASSSVGSASVEARYLVNGVEHGIGGESSNPAGQRGEALREFLAHAYESWQAPKLRYVLLLGDATFDFKDYYGLGLENLVPPLMVQTRFLRTVSDPGYAMIHGDDRLPDVAIGRLPASDPDEARAMVSKVLAFEAGALDMSGPIAFVADNADRAGNFEAHAEALAEDCSRIETSRKSI